MKRVVVSAHRTPDLLFEYAASARDRGLRAIIAGAGGAPTCRACWPPDHDRCWACPSPPPAQGMDSCSPSCRCPAGVPVATFAIGEAGAANAGLFAVSLLSVAQDGDAPRYHQQLDGFRANGVTGCWPSPWRTRHDTASRHPGDARWRPARPLLP